MIKEKHNLFECYNKYERTMTVWIGNENQKFDVSVKIMI